MAILISNVAFGYTTYIARYDMVPGLIYPPRTISIYLQRNRSVLLVSKDQAGHVVRTANLANLSSRAFASASRRVAAVNQSSHLVDRTPHEPICMDHPQFYVSVVIGDHEMQTYKDESCHKFSLEDQSADPINQLMLGLGELKD